MASAAHCPIAANDLDPAITAAIPTASSPASGCRRPRLFRGSGTWARRSSRYWLRAAGIGEDVIGERASLVAGDGERENFHRSARTLPATRRHAGHINRRYDTAGHSLTSRLCRSVNPYATLVDVKSEEHDRNSSPTTYPVSF